jgi:hypothetical protein
MARRASRGWIHPPTAIGGTVWGGKVWGGTDWIGGRYLDNGRVPAIKTGRAGRKWILTRHPVRHPSLHLGRLSYCGFEIAQPTWTAP